MLLAQELFTYGPLNTPNFAIGLGQKMEYCESLHKDIPPDSALIEDIEMDKKVTVNSLARPLYQDYSQDPFLGR